MEEKGTQTRDDALDTLVSGATTDQGAGEIDPAASDGRTTEGGAGADARRSPLGEAFWSTPALHEEGEDLIGS